MIKKTTTEKQQPIDKPLLAKAERKPLPKQIIGEIRAILALAEKRWRIDFRYPLSVLYFSVAPVLWLLPQLIYGSALTGGRYSDILYEIAGTNDVWVFTSLGLVFNMFFGVTLWSTAFGIRREEWTGTFEIIYIAPVSRISIIMGNALKSITQNSIGLFMQMGVIIYWYWGQFAFTDLLLSLLFLLVSLILVQGVAMILSGFVLWQKQGYRAVMFFEILVSIITPVTYPLLTLPTVLQYLAYGNPLMYGIEGFRNVIMFGSSVQTFVYLGVMLGTTILAVFIGVKFFSVIEKRLRKKGTIGQY